MPEDNSLYVASSEILPSRFSYFAEYLDALIRDAWLHVLADDIRVGHAATLMCFDVHNKDRTIEANLLASVAEEYALSPEDMTRVVHIQQSKADMVI